MNKIFKSRELVSIIVIFSIFLVVGIFNSSFLSYTNIFQTINGSAVYALVAIGMSFVMLTGEIDVSVGATLGFSASIAGKMMVEDKSLALVLFATVLYGTLVGTINALGIVKFKIPSIIMTLGTNGIIRGLIYVFTEGKWIENLPIEFKQLAQMNLFGSISLYFLGILVLSLIIFLLTNFTDIGKSFIAIGDNEGGARLIGIAVEKTKYISFILCSIFSSVGGILYASRVGFITPTAGTGYEMTAIAACVIGGISLSGGVGSVWGAVTGSIIMASISRVLVFLGLPSTFDNTITGLVLILIVVVGAVISRRSSEKIRKKRLAAKII